MGLSECGIKDRQRVTLREFGRLKSPLLMNDRGGSKLEMIVISWYDRSLGYLLRLWQKKH